MGIGNSEQFKYYREKNKKSWDIEGSWVDQEKFEDHYRIYAREPVEMPFHVMEVLLHEEVFFRDEEIHKENLWLVDKEKEINKKYKWISVRGILLDQMYGNHTPFVLQRVYFKGGIDDKRRVLDECGLGRELAEISLYNAIIEEEIDLKIFEAVLIEFNERARGNIKKGNFDPAFIEKYLSETNYRDAVNIYKSLRKRLINNIKEKYKDQ